MKANQSEERRLREEIKHLKECLLLAKHAEGHHDLRQAMRNQLPDHLRPYSEQPDIETLERHVSRLEADLAQLEQDDWNTAVIDSEESEE